MRGPARTQTALDLAPTAPIGLEDVIEGDGNRAALNYLRSWTDWPSPVVLLVGPEGSGKSRLAAAWSHSSGGRIVDDADAVEEIDLFAAINSALADGSPLVLTSAHPPEDWGTRTPDLHHRIANTPTFTLDEPGEDILRPVLQRLFAEHGREVGEDVIDYMLTRCPRAVRELRGVVADIEREAQSERADVTKAWVARYWSRQPELFQTDI